MNVKELRIGNFVSQNGKEIVITTLKTSWTVNDLKPISLTEDWLLNLGFEIKELNNSKQWMKFAFGLRLQNNKLYFDWIGGNTKVEFVHQLQNLFFALTGEDLEVK
jgi:hypothetical protein